MPKRNTITINGKSDYAYRIIMENHIGRKLQPGECVHHKNGDRLDDRIENLELCASNSEHLSTHHRNYIAEFPCEVCGKVFWGEKRRKHHFCSRDCWRTVKIGGRPVKNGTGKTVTANCAFCKREFTGKRNINRTLFCSHPCYVKSMRQGLS